ncbi:gonadoliberin III, partial [Vibrio sp. 10N.222.54.F6]
THKLLSAAKIHNKVVGVIELEDGRRRQSIQNMIQIWDNDQWILFSPESSQQQVQQNLLIWDESNVSLLDVVGGQNSKVHFS